MNQQVNMQECDFSTGARPAGWVHGRLARVSRLLGCPMNRFCLTILLLLISTSSFAQKAFSSLEEQMNGKEFTAAGLEKLSPAELAALNEWIRSHSVATLDAPKSTGAAAAPAVVTGTGDDRGFEIQKMQDSDRTPITSKLVGEFKGWDGQTVFKLENGMIWEQADKDKFFIKAVQNPMITIEPGAFKTWKLTVEGYSSHCKVKRIQ